MKRAIVILAGLTALAFAPAPLNRHQATRMARRMMRELRLPSGAAAATSDPSGGVLNEPPSRPATPKLVDLHAFWTLPGDPQGALDWIEQHPPAGSRLTLRGSEGRNGAPFESFAGFSFPGPTERTLLVAVTDAGGGTTALRADAEVVWLLLRPRWERVPAGVLAVTVSQGQLNTTVRDPARVHRIIALVNRLPAAQPGASGCPVDTGRPMRLVFRGASGSPPVAVATADAGGCGLVTFTLRGRQAPALAGGPQLIRRVHALLR